LSKRHRFSGGVFFAPPPAPRDNMPIMPTRAYLRHEGGTLTTTSTHTPSICTLPGLFVEGDWLAQTLAAPNLRLLDLRSAADYAEGHLPGAIQLDLAALATVVDGVQGMLIAPGAYAAIMGQLGIDGESAVVVYDANWGMPAARVVWTLAYYGHTAAAILNGGWDRWTEEGKPTTQAVHATTPARFVPQPTAHHLAELAWVQAHLHDPNVVIIDTRTPNEYAAGHLPNALSWDWMNAVPTTGWDAVGPVETLVAELTARGVTPDKEIVTYCRSGARAAHTYAVLRHLGYPRVRNFDGSWLEWSARVLGIPAH
jgi:thiosulfate/3-mercaptopyruvate sulfurtransferase